MCLVTYYALRLPNPVITIYITLYINYKVTYLLIPVTDTDQVTQSCGQVQGLMVLFHFEETLH